MLYYIVVFTINTDNERISSFLQIRYFFLEGRKYILLNKQNSTRGTR